MKSNLLTPVIVLSLSLCNSGSPSICYGSPSGPVQKEPSTAELQLEAEDFTYLGWWSEQSKESKLFYTNVIAASVIGFWGLMQWDYGSAEWHSGNEGWFQQNTKYGGADKLGHFWSTYAFADALTALYKHWGYGSHRASTYAALSSWGVQAVMEAADATSKSQGFSWQDMVMNTLGAGTSFLFERYPELDEKLDFRIEYVLNVDVDGIFDDYSNMYYSMVLKLEGFESIENSFLKYVELHAGYYTRGYESDEEENKRSLYAGISFNFSRLLRKNGWKKTGKTLEYLQVPYTVLKASHTLSH